jgi:hypothetical protein
MLSHCEVKIIIKRVVPQDPFSAGEPTTKQDVERQELPIRAQLRVQEDAKRFRGKLKWEGDLDEMRTDK